MIMNDMYQRSEYSWFYTFEYIHNFIYFYFILFYIIRFSRDGLCMM